ncbi:FMN reductase [Calidifontibacter sp. DB0510]|uniref:FMN reductase n=1 Tax=Metallococcus carri TaxID=1656884 RepID=A0A967B3N6_9MICO|nr:FMN reductase [Metallococcus carri]NHN57427.1 FMN reductase [Metallococcus carri]NOP39177.1 FMN reductase [Calidifontibacter sp. DB2511S]
MSRTIVAVTAGLTQPSSTRLLTDRIVDSIHRHISRRGEDVRVEVVELRELAHDITAMTLSGFGSQRLQDVLDQVSRADALVMVSPTFAASYSGLFKSFVDLIDPQALTDTPVLIAATAGTARHSLMLEHAMRPLFSYLHAQVVPTAIFAATDDFADESLARRIDRGAEQLVQTMLGSAAVEGFGPSSHDQPVVTSEFDDVPDFRALLGDQLN